MISQSPVPSPPDGDPDAGVAFSPDGEFIAYADRVLGDLRAAPVAGGPYRTLAHPEALPVGAEKPFEGPDAEPMFPAWGDDRMVYYTQHGIIYRVQEEGGIPQPFTTRGDAKHFFPDALPGGRGLVLSVRESFPATEQNTWIAVVGPEGGKPRRLFNGLMAQYAATGYLVYTTWGGKLMGVRFDLERLEPLGDHVVFTENVWRDIEGKSEFHFSRDGTLFFALVDPQPPGGFGFIWVGLDGMRRVDTTWVGNFSQPRLSPDHRRIAVVRRVDGSNEIWVRNPGMNWDGRASPGGANDRPTWTPDGEFLTFISDFGGQKGVWMVPSDLNGSPDSVLHQDRAITEAVWSPDGSWLVYATDPAEEGNGDILAIAADDGYSIPSSQEPIPVATNPEVTESRPALSPDGRWLAYVLSQPGDVENEIPDELWVAPFPNPGNERWLVNPDSISASEIAWAHSGQKIFYRAGSRLWAVEADTTRTPSTWRNTAVGGLSAFAGLRGWDVGEDDQSFLFLWRVPQNVTRLWVWENFFDELRERLGG
jgi:hypothetical protein